MLLPSVAVLLSWPLPNYVDPVTLGHTMTIITSIFTFLAFLVVSVRFFTRVCVLKTFGADDYLILLAMFPAIAYAVIAIISVEKYELNRHIWDVPIDLNLVSLKLTIPAMAMYSLASCLTKASMLAFTKRMVGKASKTIDRIATGALILVAASSTSFILTLIFQCTPVSAYWTPSFVPQHCINETANLLAAGIINIITDFVVVLLPFPVVWKLQMSLRLRFTVLLLFSAGFAICLAGTVRTYFTYRLTSGPDKTWYGYYVYLTGSIELYIGIICTSIPPLKPFFSKYYPVWLSSISNSLPSFVKSKRSQDGQLHSMDSQSTSKSSYFRKSAFLESSSSAGSAASNTRSLWTIREKWRRQSKPVLLMQDLETAHITRFKVYGQTYQI